MRTRSLCTALACLGLLVAAPGCAKRGMDYAGATYAEEPGYAGDADSSVELTAAFGYDPLAVGGAAAAPAAPEPLADDYADYEEAEMAPTREVSMDSAGGGGGMGASLRGAFDRAGDRREQRRAEKSAKKESHSVAAGGPARDTGGEQAPPEVALEKPDDPGKVATGKDGESKSDEQETEDHGRQIIYTAAMVVAVHDVDEATENAEQLPRRFSGFVQQRRRGVIIMKIPAAKLQRAMEELAKFGIVQARQLQAQDVTAEYTDLESRIRVLRNTQVQLLKLLEEAKTVEETLRVRQALDQVTMELETALGRMRQLSESISFSTLTIQFAERRPQQRLPSSNDPFRWVDQLGVESTEWR